MVNDSTAAPKTGHYESAMPMSKVFQRAWYAEIKEVFRGA